MPNMLLQKFPTENFTATAKVQFAPRKKNGKAMEGERAGLIVMGYDYATLALESRKDGIYLVEADCVKANKGATETEVASVKIPDDAELYLRVQVRMVGPKKPTKKEDYKAEARFSYSLDGKKFTPFGREFNVREGHWIGAKVGMFCTRDWESNDSGWLDIDWFRVTK